jgi:hypothetical protein
MASASACQSAISSDACARVIAGVDMISPVNFIEGHKGLAHCIYVAYL